jgi:glycosyltransferase involved in cell wall biosynthesis
VHVLCGHTVPWADQSDATLLRNRKWTCCYVGGTWGSPRHWWTRMRHGMIRRFPQTWGLSRKLGEQALARITPELQAAAWQFEADLYIAHYVAALSAAGTVAQKRGVLLAFDAEDFESGYYEYKTGPRAIDLLIEEVEREYLPRCSYVTAASPGIGGAHASKYGIATPTIILNVFPLRERRLQFRETSPDGALKVYWFSQTVGPDRGLEDVIRAMAVLRDCNIELHLRGRCTSGYEERLRRVAQDNKLDLAKVHFYPPAPAEEMIKLSAEYDVGLALEQPDSPNRDMCLTNKIFSYLLAGNAVAATSTTAQRAIVETLGPAGFLYEPGDSEALACGLRFWHDDRSELKRARRAAWGLGTHQFNWDLEKKKLVEVVNGVLMQRESGSILGSTASG